MASKQLSDDLKRAKNLVRGALSLLRASSTPDALRDSWKQEQLAQQQINRALAIAKKKLGRRQLAEFENWVADTVREQNNSARRIGTHLTSLGLLPEVQPQDVVTELTLSVDRLLRQHSELMVFAKDASRLAAAITNQEFIYGASILETIYKRHGYSYWAVETEIALMHASSGLDTVKSKINRMSIGTTGLNKFFLYYIGMRNDLAPISQTIH